MNKIRTFFYMIKQGFQNIAKNAFMIFASVSVIFVSLFIIGTMFLLSYNIESILDDLASGPAVVINCKTTLSEEETDKLQDMIEINKNVSKITRISRAENLAAMKEFFSEQQDLFEDYKEEDLFVSFEVELYNVGEGEKFVSEVKNMVGVDSVRDTVRVLKLFTTLKKWVQIGTVIAVIGLGILSYLLTSNTIKLTVVARKQELEIMKYVGASSAYVRGPFIMEGLFIGLLGSGLSYLLVRLVYNIIANYVNGTEIGDMIHVVPFTNFSGTLMVYFIIAAVAIGVLGSMTAIRKHIKV